MGQVSVTLNDRVYRLVCDEGEEDRLVELATYVKAKVTQLTAEVGRAGDERLLLMAALMIADELWDARAALDAQSASAIAAAVGSRPDDSVEPEAVRRLKSVAASLATGDETPGTDPSVAPVKPSRQSSGRRRETG